MFNLNYGYIDWQSNKRPTVKRGQHMRGDCDDVEYITIQPKGRAVINEIKELMNKQQERRYVVYTAEDPGTTAWRNNTVPKMASENAPLLITGVHVEKAARISTWMGAAKYKTEISITSVANLTGKQLIPEKS